MPDLPDPLLLLPHSRQSSPDGRLPAAAAMLKLRRPMISFLQLSVCSFSSSISSCHRRRRLSPPPSVSPPAAKRVPFVSYAHGVEWQDPYRWMADTGDPDLTDYLVRENAYGDAFMADTAGLRRELVEEMKCRIPAKITTPPERWGPWLYYQCIPEGMEYPVLCRRPVKDCGWLQKVVHYVGGNEREEILLDWNEIAEQFGYVHIGTCRVSPDHNFLAYALDTNGSESFILQVKDLRHGCPMTIPKVQGVVSLAWAQDSCTLFYTLTDETHRPYRVYSTKLDSDSPDSLLYNEDDMNCCVDITSTKDGKYITINSNSRTSSEVYLLNSSNPHDRLQLVRRRVPDVKYFVEHHQGNFYILTNAPLKNAGAGGGYYLAIHGGGNLPLSEWQGVVHPGSDATFEDMDMFNGHLVLFLEKGGFPAVCSVMMPFCNNCKDFLLQPSLKLEDLEPWFFPFPSDNYGISAGSNHDFMTDVYRVVLSSPVMPDVIVDYDMSNKKVHIVHQEEVSGISGDRNDGVHCDHSEINGFDYENLTDGSKMRIPDSLFGSYSCESVEVISHDGIKVPLTIVYSPKVKRNGKSPGLLQGYGAYGEALDKGWQAERSTLLDRGWVTAYADVRGGGGGSVSWHQDGTMRNKTNSIYDFVACGNYLVSEGYVSREMLCAIGYSAGGLLVGASINMNPNLFCAAILKVPFLDICNTLMDPSLPLTLLDHGEFGNPQNEAHFKTIRSYSPYDNITAKACYPSMLLTASFNDSRVGVWEAAKYVARVREETCPSCSCSVILRTNMTGGHFAEGGRYSQSEDAAYEYAFLIKAVGMAQ